MTFLPLTNKKRKGKIVPGCPAQGPCLAADIFVEKEIGA